MRNVKGHSKHGKRTKAEHIGFGYSLIQFVHHNRRRQKKGFSLPEAVVSMSVFGIFMTVCCGSIVNYQNAFMHVEKSFNYAQNLHVALNQVTRELGNSSFKTLVDEKGDELQFPASTLRFQLPNGIDEHGASTFGNIIEYKASNNQLLRIEYTNSALTEFTTRVIANNVEGIEFRRLCADFTHLTADTECADDNYLENALEFTIDSKYILNPKTISSSSGSNGGHTTTTSTGKTVTVLNVYGESECSETSGSVESAGSEKLGKTTEADCSKGETATTSGGKKETVSTVVYLAN